MPAYLDTLNKLLASGTIVLQIVTVFIVVNLLFLRSKENKNLIFFKRYGFHFGFLVAFGSVCLSIFYSNFIGFPPCELCWIQRIFLYPQVILFGMELYKKDKTMINHSIVMAIFGSIASIFHIYVENGGASSLACATGTATQVSCATRYIYEFGYITIPTMALTASVFLIVLMLNYKYMTRS